MTNCLNALWADQHRVFGTCHNLKGGLHRCNQNQGNEKLVGSHVGEEPSRLSQAYRVLPQIY
uniref:Uncharacterized protein n=1 Tax=Rhizophora mucronata TaxID=61149 RepID=A0A2P2N260_RHIMU